MKAIKIKRKSRKNQDGKRQGVTWREEREGVKDATRFKRETKRKSGTKW